MEYLLPALGLAPFSILLWVLYFRQKKIPRKVCRPVPGLRLRLSHSGGILEDFSFPAGLIRCGFSPDYEINLAHYTKAGRNVGKSAVEELSLQLDQGRLTVIAHGKVMLDGVERSSGSISVGGSVLFQTCRFTFLGQTELQKETNILPGAATLRRLAAAPSVTSLVAIILLILGLFDLGTSGFFQRPESRLALAKEQPVPRSDLLALPSPYLAPRVVRPGEPIPEEQVDVLFIHAHPDDESIDFGTLMALCEDAGLTTALVLMTDGEGGIYQQDYAGPRDNMAAIRVQEAAKALQVLGTSLYIRLGLPNSPYNSLLEEKGVQEVLRLWDGDAVSDRLAQIISTLDPRVVVSPEGPSFAHEHFEHETTGVLTLMALQQLRSAGGHIPEAHLVSVDPRHKDAYTGLIAFPRQQVMERQRQALLAHETQADASYFGVRIIEKYREEYYLIQYWNLAVHHADFFDIAQGQHQVAPGLGSTFLVRHTREYPVP